LVAQVRPGAQLRTIMIQIQGKIDARFDYLCFKEKLVFVRLLNFSGVRRDSLILLNSREDVLSDTYALA